jgi:polysaccharide export outer membrane protein
MIRRVRLLSLLAAALFAAGCTHLPIDGPMTAEIVKPAGLKPGAVPPYLVIDLTTPIAERLGLAPVQSFKAQFGDQAVTDEDTLKAGDFIAVTLWEVGAASPLLGSSPNPGTSIGTLNQTVPDQMIADDGTVSIPFAGRVVIAGLTLPEAENKISGALKGKASQPQTVISVTKNNSNLISILGDDIKGATVVLPQGNNRVLDAIAGAGGVESPTYQAQVRLIRGTASVMMPLQDIVDTPSENIHLHPKDTLVVSKTPGFFTVLGATGKNAQIQFQTAHMNLSEALANAGGLLDERADPRGVFIFRVEPIARARAACPNCDFSPYGAFAPVVYRLDMSQAAAFFTSQRFQLADHDIVFVANSPRVQLQKVLSLVRDLFSPLLTTFVVAHLVDN